KEAAVIAPVETVQAPIAATVTEASSGSRYTLLQKIGGGGMAEVHLAVSVGERGFRRPCVIKRLRPELSENPAAVAQFTDEATLASSLVHANIVPIFDFARVGSQYFLVEEYIVGRDLGRVSRRARAVGTPMAPELVGYVAVETLKALDYAHSKRDHDGLPLGIVHRDISPENLMVTVRGEVQLLDFGVIKIDEARKRRTDIGELKGNLSYIAPEQARSLAVDGRADLFSLGMVIYFCLTGEHLYGIDAGSDLLVKAAAGPGPEEMAKIARLPAPFNRVLPRALAPRPEARFPTAVAFAEAFGPSPVDAPARLGSLVAKLFGDELADEQTNLSLGVGGRNTAGSVAKVLPGPGSTSEQPVPLPLRGH
ncbi:MAG TPA: serine/threonine-protein kinase, partial [Polyangia bacterium]